MAFVVPQGSSDIRHLSLTPVEPIGGIAQPWVMKDITANPPVEVQELNTEFSLNSSPDQRLLERMIFVITIDDSVQTSQESWRFINGGMMYCEGEADYLDDVNTGTSNDQKTLSLSVKCLTNIDEEFNFSFLAVRKDNATGQCDIFASPDPRGSSGRR